MLAATLNEEQLKAILKEALREIIEEKRDLFRGLILDALEDAALIQAIEEGESSGTVSRSDIFQILEHQT